ncbi:hypothetical protein [Labedaea rhizosphaerae]|uniref:hypothetical protein n=1 Tax=Labedaea rhizosphaerae TaxID=598644 RepID=UPI001060C91B|nr:hypothetical protein [Labedaea rhizosphaerae]
MSSEFTPPVRRVNSGRGHRYEDAHGRKVPGVTTVISSGVPKPALINWAARVTAAYAVDYWDELAELPVSERLTRLEKARFGERDEAARRGTQVHSLAERLVHGEEVDVPEALAGHVRAYVDFLDQWRVQPVLAEFVVASHRHGYAGTADLLAYLDDPDEPGRAVPWLLDIKTSQGVWGETALQLAAYRYADVYRAADGTELPVPEVERTGVVHVLGDGYQLVPVVAGRAQHRTFLYAQQIAAFVDTAKELVGEPLTPPRTLEAA